MTRHVDRMGMGSWLQRDTFTARKAVLAFSRGASTALICITVACNFCSAGNETRMRHA
jgi:hypothetical protein